MLTSHFLNDLAKLNDKLLLFFFDSVDCTTKKTQTWLLDTLIPQLSTFAHVRGLCCKKETDLLKLGEKRTRGLIMTEQHPFKWRHFQSDLILLCVRWYLRYALSYRDLEEMMMERGLQVDHTTIYRWVQTYAPELEKRSRPHLKACNDSWRVDETYIKVKKEWVYLYRAVDSDGLV